MNHALRETETLRRQLQREGSLVLDVKVTPRARLGEVTEVMTNGVLKIKVTAAPERGKANEEVCALLSTCFGVPRRSVEIMLGHTSPQKRVRILLPQ